MKNLAAAAALLAGTLAAPARTQVEWKVVGNEQSPDSVPSYVQRFIVKGDMSNLHRLCFNQFDRKMKVLTDGVTVGRLIPGYYFIETPAFGAKTDSVVIDILTEGSVVQYSFGADGVHGVDRSGHPFEVDFRRLSQTADPEQWMAKGVDRMPYGDEFYEINERLTESAAPVGAYDVLPSFKNVSLTHGGIYKGGQIVSEKIADAENPEFYTIDVSTDGIHLTGASEAALATARRMARRLVALNPDGLPAAHIADWPDYGYRGVMIDVARNFQTLDQMKKFIDEMALIRLNRLQFHFIDDEAWRLEIPGLPELTDFGSRKGYTTDEAEFLGQTYSGVGDPDSPLNGGHYSRAEFIGFLRYAAERGVTVIPEVETPGHARAAVLAMEKRFRDTGDGSFRLREDGDTSVYVSAQDFSDNVINPVLPSSLKFVEKVFDEIIAMYAEAGVPLESIHIGGDEVPDNAWTGSPSVQRFMAANGMTTESELHGWWVARLNSALAERGVKLSGWQEIGLGHSREFADSVTPNVHFVNLWVSRPMPDGQLRGTKALELGYPIVVSAAQNYYYDFAYSTHPDERGLNWGGTPDEFKALDGYPRLIAPAPDNARSNIVGVQAQMWGETMRSPEWMESYLFPRLFGMAERAWNSDTTYTHSRFNDVLAAREIPDLVARGYNFHLRQPGVKLLDGGRVAMNSPYAEAEIRYTLDGSDPTDESAVYKAPFTLPEGVRQIRATLFWLGRRSVPSILNFGR